MQFNEEEHHQTDASWLSYILDAC